MTYVMSESGFPLWGEDIQRTLNMCSGLVALTREDLLNPPRILTSGAGAREPEEQPNYVNRFPTYESERIWNSPHYIPGRGRNRRLGKRTEHETQKKIVKNIEK